MNIKLIEQRDNNLSFVNQVLKNRGLNKDVSEFLSLNWECVNSPHNLDFIENGVRLFFKHNVVPHKIAVLVDADMDGFSSAALLINYVMAQKKFGDSDKFQGIYIPMFHLNKAHGLDDKEIMRRLRDEIKPDLLIIPDASGSTDQYKALEEIGIDILVLDHHDMSERGNGINVVVINNQQSEKYTNKNLSGVGIVWQFCRALDEQSSFVCADRYLDLVAIGNVGDVMDMRSPETYFLCHQGMNNSNIFSNFINYLKFSSYNMKDKDYCSNTIAFNIAPLFNAVCRIGNIEEKEMLFKCLLDEESITQIPSGKRGHADETVTLVEEGCRLATNAKSRQDLRKNKLIEKIQEVIDEEHMIDDPVLILAFDDFEEDYRALTGLVASGLSDYYNRPVILAFKNPDGSYLGSLRAPDKIPAYENFKDQCAASECFIFVSGHQQAAGAQIKAGYVEKVRNYFKEKYKNLDTTLCEKVDFIIDAQDPELVDLIYELSKYNTMWGTNLEAPKIAVKNVRMGASTMSLLGAKKNTLKITSTDGVEFINFKSSQTEYDSLQLPYDGVEQFYNATLICVEPSINNFRGVETPQLQFIAYDLDGVKYDF